MYPEFKSQIEYQAFVARQMRQNERHRAICKAENAYEGLILALMQGLRAARGISPDLLAEHAFSDRDAAEYLADWIVRQPTR